jgi:hypothetical protein
LSFIATRNHMAKKSKSIPTLDEQLQQRMDSVYRDKVIYLVQENAHLTLEELSALKVLLNTPLHELASIEARRAAAPKNGTSAKVKVKKKTPTNGVKKSKSVPAMDLDTFLKDRSKGDAFKTAEYTTAAKIGQQTALNHLNKSNAVEKQGERRGVKWVVQ